MIDVTRSHVQTFWNFNQGMAGNAELNLTKYEEQRKELMNAGIMPPPVFELKYQKALAEKYTRLGKFSAVADLLMAPCEGPTACLLGDITKEKRVAINMHLIEVCLVKAWASVDQDAADDEQLQAIQKSIETRLA